VNLSRLSVQFIAVLTLYYIIVVRLSTIYIHNIIKLTDKSKYNIINLSSYQRENLYGGMEMRTIIFIFFHFSDPPFATVVYIIFLL